MLLSVVVTGKKLGVSYIAEEECVAYILPRPSSISANVSQSEKQYVYPSWGFGSLL